MQPLQVKGEIENVEVINRVKVCASLRDFETILGYSFVLDRSTKTIGCRTTYQKSFKAFSCATWRSHSYSSEEFHPDSEEKVRDIQVQKSIHARYRDIGRKALWRTFYSITNFLTCSLARQVSYMTRVILWNTALSTFGRKTKRSCLNLHNLLLHSRCYC